MAHSPFFNPNDAKHAQSFDDMINPDPWNIETPRARITPDTTWAEVLDASDELGFRRELSKQTLLPIAAEQQPQTQPHHLCGWV